MSWFPPDRMPQQASLTQQAVVTALGFTPAPSGAYLTTVSWTDVSGKPTTFTPATHGHAIADVTGLQTALNAKQASGDYATNAALTSGLATKQATGNYLTTLGYVVGEGGAVTQATNKATAVTLNKLTGLITLNAAALAAGAIVTFTLNNSTLAATDMLVVNHQSAGTVGPYLITPRVTGAGGATITIRNTSAASLAEAIVIKFAVIRSAIA